MIEKKQQAVLLAQGRDFTRGYRTDDPYIDQFESDQQLKLPQPPMVKPPMAPGECPNRPAQKL